MGIEWDDIHVFQTAVRAGDYTTAARKLGMDRTTVGRRFARLERAAGRSLWEQTSQGYRPTDAGRAVLRAASTMERAMARLTTDLAIPEDKPGGLLRVAGTAGIGALLLPQFGSFLDSNPGIAIEVVGARDAIAAVQQRQADIGIAIARSKPRDLAGHRIGGFEHRRYALADHPPDRPVGWGHAMLLANPQPWARLNAPAGSLATVEVDSIASLHQAVRAGMGTAWLWRVLGDNDPALRRLDDVPPSSAAADLWIVHRGDLTVEPAVIAFRDAATAILDRFVRDHAANGRPAA